MSAHPGRGASPHAARDAPRAGSAAAPHTSTHPIVHAAARLLVLLSLGVAPAAGAAQPPLAVTRARALPNDLPGVRVLDRARGLVFRVYYDSASRAVATAALPRLADLYAAVAATVGADPARVEWFSVAFVADTGYVPPRTIPGEVRYTVATDRGGTLGARGERDLYLTIPHEQVHAVQGSFGLNPPRWFGEGQAQWAGLAVARRWRPALADADRRSRPAPSDGPPLRLAAWGGVSVKREAIVRQATPEQQARMAKDSTYMPPGPFDFGPGDLVSDESQTGARYAAALALFEEAAAARGPGALTRWFATLWDGARPATTEALAAGFRSHTGVDVTARLR